MPNPGTLEVFGDLECRDFDVWQLPRGPNAGAPVETVSAAQRARLQYAIVMSVADKGYNETTIADIVKIARVSRSAFYAHFEDKEDCFLSAYEAAHLSLLQTMKAGQDAKDDWRQRLSSSLRAYLGFKHAHPELAHAMLVEIHAAGINARRTRDWGHQRFAEMHRRLYERRCQAAGVAPCLPTEVFLATVAAVEEVVASYVCDGRTQDILDAEPAAMYILLSLYDNPNQGEYFRAFRESDS